MGRHRGGQTHACCQILPSGSYCDIRASTPLDQLFVAARQFADENSCLPESPVSLEITSCRPLLFLPAAIASPEVFLPAQRNESLSTAAKLSSSLLSHDASLTAKYSLTTSFQGLSIPQYSLNASKYITPTGYVLFLMGT